MRYRVILPKSVQKELDRLPGEVAARILDRLRSFESNPRPPAVKSPRTQGGVGVLGGLFRAGCCMARGGRVAGGCGGEGSRPAEKPGKPLHKARGLKVSFLPTV